MADALVMMTPNQVISDAMLLKQSPKLVLVCPVPSCGEAKHHDRQVAKHLYLFYEI
jgi:hypothetical protein